MKDTPEMKNVTFKYKITKRRPGYAENTRLLEELKFVHVIGGVGIWNINGKNYEVAKDDIIIFSRNDTRYIKDVISRTDFVVEQIVFLPVTLYPMQNCARYFFERSEGFCNVVPKDNPYYQRLLENFAAIADEVNNQNPWKNEYITNLIISMAITAARIFVSGEEKNTTLNNAQYENVCKVISYINNNLQEDLSRDALAKKLYISPSYLSRIFKEYSGVCLQDYIVKCRVQNAINLIKQGHRPIDAAFESGFSSTSGFYRAFHAVTGQKPKDIT